MSKKSKKDSFNDRQYSGPTAILERPERTRRAPSLAETRAKIGAEATRLSILRYIEADRHVRETDEQTDGGRDCDNWIGVAETQKEEAAAAVVRAILAWSLGEMPSTVCLNPETHLWSPSAVVHDGVLYIASPDSDYSNVASYGAGYQEHDKQQLMRLTVVPIRDIIALDPILADDGALGTPSPIDVLAWPNGDLREQA